MVREYSFSCTFPLKDAPKASQEYHFDKESYESSLKRLRCYYINNKRVTRATYDSMKEQLSFQDPIEINKKVIKFLNSFYAKGFFLDTP
jgi:hypothetical protein